MIKRILRDELIKGSAILIMATIIANSLGYLFQLIMARTLGPEEYGIFVVLVSFIYFLSIPTDSIQSVISKKSNEYWFKKDYDKIFNLFKVSIYKGLIFSLAIYLILLPATYILSKTLEIDFKLFIITNLFIFLVSIFSVLRGVLQGRKQFFALGMTSVLEGALKLLIGSLLVILGFSIIGAIGGIIISTIFALGLSLYWLRDLRDKWKSSKNNEQIYLKNTNMLLSIFSVILIYGVDVFIARLSLSPELAGSYAFISLIGKIVFLINSSVARAMLPITTEAINNGGDSKKIFLKSLTICLVNSIIFVLVFLFFSEETIYILSLGSEKYLPMASSLWIVGLAYVLLSISYLIIIYLSSLGDEANNSKILLFSSLAIIIIQILVSEKLSNSVNDLAVIVLFGALFFLVAISIATLTRIKFLTRYVYKK